MSLRPAFFSPVFILIALQCEPFIRQIIMGKAQSKRSVDITTEPSREIQEGSGELKKLDDTYFKENESSVSDTQKNVHG